MVGGPYSQWMVAHSRVCVQYKLNSALLETKKEKEKKKQGLADEGRIWEELGGREGLVMIKIY